MAYIIKFRLLTQKYYQVVFDVWEDLLRLLGFQLGQIPMGNVPSSDHSEHISDPTCKVHFRFEE